MQINKEGKVRRSKWDIQPLSPDQQIYAAIDVYVSLLYSYYIVFFLIQTIISSFLNLLPDQTSHFRTRKCLSTRMLKSVTQW